MKSPEAILDQARDLHRLGDLERALRLYKQGLAARPRLAPAWYLYGVALRQDGQWPAAADALRKAVALLPTEAAARRELSEVEVRLGRFDAAIDVFRTWAKAEASRPEPVRHLVSALVSLHRIEEGLRECEAGLLRFPGDPVLLLAHARVCERAGKLDEARRSAEALLKATPEDAGARLVLSRLAARGGDRDAERSMLEGVIATTPPGETAGMALLDLGQNLDRAGRHEEAMAAVHRGKAMLLAGVPSAQRDTAPHLRFAEHMRARLTPEVVGGWSELPEPTDGPRSPVFITGFPRTGTTLIEQILSAHPALFPTDELDLLQPVRDVLNAHYMGQRLHYPDWLGRMNAKDAEKARRSYFERARWHAGDVIDRKRLVDKQPLNTPDIPLMTRMFPNAPVVFVLRDPRDTCLSCYFQTLRNVPAFYDLRATAELYAATMRLWLHFRATLKFRWMELRYEDLVADTPGQARRLLEFIGEPWDDNVLAFHEEKNRRFVITPSYQDVARPVYTSAKARWKKYRTALESVLPVLEPFVSEFGYEAH
ncbi:MAG: sulfotransferase [Planctomycetes bacterium]|nr:sulfotransferase [Planctomycetota bacterium]